MSELSIRELNQSAKTPQILIENTEAAYHGELSKIVDRIIEEGVRVLLLAGPSGSGKTTTANLLADGLRVRGHEAAVVSLDNFYRAHTDPLYPKLADGSPDMESADALDLPAITECIQNILAGGAFDVPRYDFSVSAPASEGYHFPSMGDGCVILEGLHALNPRITAPIATAHLYKMFISVSTNINLDGERILSGRKLRFARRVVRDNLYRGASPERTLAVWQSVLDGEDKYLYPFRDTADITMNTFHDFEVGLLKPFIENLLVGEVAKSSYARAVLAGFSHAEAIPEPLVPETSLLREFIPGGVYEALY